MPLRPAILLVLLLAIAPLAGAEPETGRDPDVLRRMEACFPLRQPGVEVPAECLQELTCVLADTRAIAVAVDLEGTRRSNRWAGCTHVMDGAWTVLRHAEILGRGSFRVRHLGSTPTGCQWYETVTQTGGSSAFPSYLVVRLRDQQEPDTDGSLRDVTMVERVCEIPLGAFDGARYGERVVEAIRHQVAAGR